MTLHSEKPVMISLIISRFVAVSWRDIVYILIITLQLATLSYVFKNNLSLSSFQSSEPKGYVGVDPLELRFPFELNKEISCVMQLTNRTDDSIAFNTCVNKQKYYTQPEEGIMPPYSKRYITVTMRAQESAPPDMQCNDVFLVRSTTMSKDDFMCDDIIKRLRNMTMTGNMVDEERLPIVYVALPQPPHPSCEGPITSTTT